MLTHSDSYGCRCFFSNEALPAIQSVHPGWNVLAWQVKLAYDKFSNTLRGFEKKCREAASYKTEDDEVEAAYVSLNNSLDELLRTAMQ
jgi:hypothetical protein